MKLPVALAFAAAALPWVRGAEDGGLGPVQMDGYTQTFVVHFRSAAAAGRAVVRIVPLYHDFSAAFSTRMDDSTVNDLVVPVVMAKYGQKGTFYLNSLDSWYQDSPETGISEPKDAAREIPRRLLAGGNSIGGHTLSHEFLPALSKNAAFGEIMANRASLEVGTGTPVNSFVYPFISFHDSDLRNGTDREDLEAMIRRAGYYQLAEHRYNTDWDSGLQDAVFLELDGRSGGGKYSEAAVTEKRGYEERPLFLVTMHAWVSNWGAPDFPRLAAIYARWSGRSDLWYCNTSEYAAYRYQARHSRLSTEVHGDTVRAVLVRPDPRDLNDGIPLTFRVEGVAAADVVSAEDADADLVPVPLGTAFAFDLPHDRGRGVPQVYGSSYNPDNSRQLDANAAAAGGLQALLSRENQLLVLALRNAGAAPLDHLRVTFRLPLRWQEGAPRRMLPALGPGESARIELPLTERAAPAAYAVGPELDEAQVNFAGAQRGRVYAACSVPDGDPSAAYPRHGFWILGPLAGDEADFDPLAFSQAFLEGAPPKTEYAVHWSGNLAWRTLDPARASLLDPDLIPTTGKASIPKFYVGDASVYFPHRNAQYLLYGLVEVPAAREARAVFRRDCVRRLSLNGQVVDGDRLQLRPGTNDLRILYAPAQSEGASFDPANYGCYFRLVDARGRPMEDVRYRRPELPGAPKS